MPVSPKPSVLLHASCGRAWFKACSPSGQWTGASQNQSYRVNSWQQDHQPVLLSKVPLVPQTPPAHNCLINEYVNESPAGSLPSRTPKASWISRETSAFLIPIGPAPGSRGTLPNQPPCFTVEETEAWGGASHMAGLGEAGMH